MRIGRQAFGWGALLLAMMVTRPAACAEPDNAKATVPSGGAKDAALATVRDIYATDLQKAGTAEQKAALATKMLERSKGLAGDVAGTFAILQVARELAIESGNPPLTLEVLAAVEDRFNVEGPVLKAAAIGSLCRTARTPQQRSALAAATLQVIDELADGDRFPEAEKLAEAVTTAARKNKDFAVVKQLVARLKQAAARQDAQRAVNEALATLKSKPDDPQANLAVGCYYALTRQDWEKGLPYLALGSDATLKDLAARELQNPNTAKAMLELADGWFEAAGDAEEAQAAQKIHAGTWYRKAQAEIKSALERLKVERRLAEIEAIEERVAKPAPPPVSEEPTAGPRGNALLRIVARDCDFHSLRVSPKGIESTGNRFRWPTFEINGRPWDPKQQKLWANEGPGRMIPAGVDFSLAEVRIRRLGAWADLNVRYLAECVEIDLRHDPAGDATFDLEVFLPQRRAGADLERQPQWIGPWKVKGYGFDPSLHGLPPRVADVERQSPLATDESPELNWDWWNNPPLKNLPKDNAVIIAVRSFEAKGGVYRLETLSDDGIRVWIDGRPVLENWSNHMVRQNAAQFPLRAGEHTMRVEYYEAGALSRLGVWLRRLQ